MLGGRLDIFTIIIISSLFLFSSRVYICPVCFPPFTIITSPSFTIIISLLVFLFILHARSKKRKGIRIIRIIPTFPIISLFFFSSPRVRKHHNSYFAVTTSCNFSLSSSCQEGNVFIFFSFMYLSWAFPYVFILFSLHTPRKRKSSSCCTTSLN